ncbi:c-type cytochrome [Yanghanlia caeni]|uniref:C-type cytochrome n=1 Tax=Yanghanlia caeni TaxID=3064283 RepID=A0ABU1D8X9_9BURK|nr:c-type cytochrome [Alcaligenaceae bacterium LG-2]NGR09236.1 c-type cytochrome [bacterium SGD-2]HZH57830.1 c-type cytochrome [Burkholderiaceae bacterium]
MKLRSTLTRALAVLAATFSCAATAQDKAGDNGITGDPAAARSKVSMCIGCHGIPGYKASFPEVYHVPKIAGQNAEYIVTALQDYASGARTFPSMEAIAQSLSPQDMADLAAYYSSLK